MTVKIVKFIIVVAIYLGLLSFFYINGYLGDDSKLFMGICGLIVIVLAVMMYIFDKHKITLDKLMKSKFMTIIGFFILLSAIVRTCSFYSK